MSFQFNISHQGPHGFLDPENYSKESKDENCVNGASQHKTTKPYIEGLEEINKLEGGCGLEKVKETLVFCVSKD